MCGEVGGQEYVSGFCNWGNSHNSASSGERTEAHFSDSFRRMAHIPLSCRSKGKLEFSSKLSPILVAWPSPLSNVCSTGQASFLGAPLRRCAPHPSLRTTEPTGPITLFCLSFCKFPECTNLSPLPPPLPSRLCSSLQSKELSSWSLVTFSLLSPSAFF